jgi:GNAT superfamily N-acetyltransferase
VVKIREASGRDVDTVVDLISEMLREMASYSSRELSGESRVRSQLRGRFAESLGKEHHAYLVATVGDADELVGIVEVSLVSPDGIFSSGLVVHVHSLYVRLRYRRQGIGRRLLEAGLAWGKARGCVEAELSVLARSPARELYERMGFEVSELEMRVDL